MILLFIVWYLIGLSFMLWAFYNEKEKKYITLGEIIISILCGVGGTITPALIMVLFPHLYPPEPQWFTRIIERIKRIVNTKIIG
jgi:RsiW-degrading membrane proteinase PrsW (M82 family)